MNESRDNVPAERTFSPVRLLLSVGYVSFLIWTFLQVVRHKAYNRLEKGAWSLVLLFSPLVGPILWFLVGRRGVVKRR